MKYLYKILAGVAGIVLLGILTLVLLSDHIAKTAMLSSIRSQTGLEAEISRVRIGLLQPRLRVEGFVLNSQTNFNSAPMLRIPELEIHYDRDAAQRQELHLKYLRLDLAEVRIVEDLSGKTNLTTFPGWLSKIQIPKGHVPEGSVQFRGIDVLDLSLGVIRFESLRDPSRNREVQLGIVHERITNVISETNLYPLLIKLAVRGGLQMFADPGTLLGPAAAP